MRKKTHIALIVILSVILVGLLFLAVMLSLGKEQWKLPTDENLHESTVSQETMNTLKGYEEESDSAEETELVQEQKDAQAEPAEHPKKEKGEDGGETTPERPTEEETMPGLSQPSGEPTQSEESANTAEETEETLPVEDSYTRGTLMPDDEL